MSTNISFVDDYTLSLVRQSEPVASFFAIPTGNPAATAPVVEPEVVGDEVEDEEEDDAVTAKVVKTPARRKANAAPTEGVETK